MKIRKCSKVKKKKKKTQQNPGSKGEGITPRNLWDV